MSVKLLDNEAFYGYRVRRTVNGTLYQEYYSLKQNGKRIGPQQQKAIERKAVERDKELQVKQDRSKERRKGEMCFKKDGSVKGISYLIKKEKSGTLTPIFQIGIASEVNGKIVCTSFSINAHGKKRAWEMAVDSYAEHKKISKRSKLYQDLLKAAPKSQKADEKKRAR